MNQVRPRRDPSAVGAVVRVTRRRRRVGCPLAARLAGGRQPRWSALPADRVARRPAAEPYRVDGEASAPAPPCRSTTELGRWRGPVARPTSSAPLRCASARAVARSTGSTRRPDAPSTLAITPRAAQGRPRREPGGAAARPGKWGAPRPRRVWHSGARVGRRRWRGGHGGDGVWRCRRQTARARAPRT